MVAATFGILWDRLHDVTGMRRRVMGKLIYSMITSMDGYTTDADGNHSWSEPDEELHAFINEYVSSIGTFLYGRRIYQEMAVWETIDQQPGKPAVIQDFARRWRAADKVVYSRTLDEVSTSRTRLVREFDPDEVRQLKTEAERDITVDGPTLAASAIRAGLVDEFHRFVVPVVVGGGTRYMPDRVRFDLDLLDERRFADGTVYLRYGVRG